jgi:hypothetical protein
MYANLVDAIGIEQILTKGAGGDDHTGGAWLHEGTQLREDFAAFLEML